MNKNLQMLKDTNEKYCCCLGCGKKMKNEDGVFECKKCEQEREASKSLEQLQRDLARTEFLIKNISWEQPPSKRPETLKELTTQRNKLNRQITTLKKANLKQ